jgi:hypothetical protein
MGASSIFMKRGGGVPDTCSQISPDLSYVWLISENLAAAGRNGDEQELHTNIRTMTSFISRAVTAIRKVFRIRREYTFAESMLMLDALVPIPSSPSVLKMVEEYENIVIDEARLAMPRVPVRRYGGAPR